MNKITIIGSGMAGLLARQAVSDAKGDTSVRLLSTSQPRRISWSELHGVHVLHDRCGMNIREMFVTNMVAMPMVDEPQLLAEMSEWERKMANGTYGQKVYGSRKASTSIKRMPGVIEGYDYVQAFNKLVAKYITDVQIHKPIYEDALHDIASKNDLVVLAIPRYHVTPKWVKHPFATVFVAPSPPIGFEIPSRGGDNCVVYNADPSVDWSRTARITVDNSEYWTTEYTKAPAYFIPNLRQVEKVIDGETFALPENVIPVGRYGKWKSGVLSHDAYWTVVEEMRKRGMATL